MLDDCYNIFCSEVAESRNLSLHQQHEWAEGKIFSGNQAYKLNLIDKIGSFSDAEDIIGCLIKKRCGKLQGKIVYLAYKETFMGQLVNALLKSAGNMIAQSIKPRINLCSYTSTGSVRTDFI